jgi:hypothetical protein
MSSPGDDADRPKRVPLLIKAKSPLIVIINQIFKTRYCYRLICFVGCGERLKESIQQMQQMHASKKVKRVQSRGGDLETSKKQTSVLRLHSFAAF